MRPQNIILLLAIVLLCASAVMAQEQPAAVSNAQVFEQSQPLTGYQVSAADTLNLVMRYSPKSVQVQNRSC